LIVKYVVNVTKGFFYQGYSYLRVRWL
jgi:hypothetical protein